MTYEEFIDELTTRVNVILTNIRSQLIAAGAASNRVTITTPNTVDLRFQIDASTGNGGNLRRITAYVELTDASRFGEPANGKGYLTLLAQTNQGGQVAHTYSPGSYEFYTNADGIELLRAKLTELENAIPQLITNARSYLRL